MGVPRTHPTSRWLRPHVNTSAKWRSYFSGSKLKSNINGKGVTVDNNNAVERFPSGSIVTIVYRLVARRLSSVNLSINASLRSQHGSIMLWDSRPSEI